MTTELVIISPFFFFMMLSLVQFGLWLHAVNVASATAQEAAAIARARDGTIAAAEARGNTFLASTSLRLWEAPPTVQVSYINGDQEARAVVDGNMTGIIPFFTFTVHEVSEGPVERFRAPGEEQDP